VREDGRIVGGENWQEKEYNREEWNNLVSLHTPIKMHCQQNLKLGKSFVSARIDFYILGC
jgi:hypothetical protein